GRVSAPSLALAVRDGRVALDEHEPKGCVLGVVATEDRLHDAVVPPGHPRHARLVEHKCLYLLRRPYRSPHRRHPAEGVADDDRAAPVKDLDEVGDVGGDTDG